MVTVVKTAPEKSNFNFTFSKLKSFEVCPRRYYQCDVLKQWQEAPSDHLIWGDEVHKALAATLKTGCDLPLSMRGYQQWVDRINRTPGELLVEDQAKFAIDDGLKPCGWFAPSVWLRGIVDAMKIDENAHVALIVDFKTGKSSNADEVQLIVLALLAFCHFPKLLMVRADFVFLQNDAQTTVVMHRDELASHWASLMPRVDRLRRAHETEEFPPLPNNFCRRWCPVKSCEYFGR